jgi:hypothetical protein
MSRRRWEFVGLEEVRLWCCVMTLGSASLRIVLLACRCVRCSLSRYSDVVWHLWSPGFGFAADVHVEPVTRPVE